MIILESAGVIVEVVISVTYIFVLIKWVPVVDYFQVAQFQISTLYLLVLNKVVKNNYISVEK